MLIVLLWVVGLLSKGVQRGRTSVGDGHLRNVPAEPRKGTLSDRGSRRTPFGCKQCQQIRQAVEADGLPRHCSNSKKKSVNSINGTSGGTCMATRNHVAMAAWSVPKSDVSGRSGFDWSGQ